MKINDIKTIDHLIKNIPEEKYANPECLVNLLLLETTFGLTC